MTGTASGRAAPFPILPLDQFCIKHINAVADRKVWQSFDKRTSNYFRFPPKDVDDYLTVPTVPDSTRDKLAADGSGSSSTRSLFSDRTRNKIEDTLRKADWASRYGMRSTSFLLLLSEYLVRGCEEETAIPVDMLSSAFRCLDETLRLTLEQFTRISVLATSA